MTTINNDIWRRDATVMRARLRRSLFGRLRDAVGAWRARRANQPLDVLDDRMLRDIGMARSNIEHGVRRHRTGAW
jgi:uncharacterized protein YjiS (DUF1127 family)